MRARSSYLRIFNKLAQILNAEDASLAPSRESPPNGNDDTVLSIAAPKLVRTVSSRTGRELDDEDAHLPAIQREIYELHHLPQVNGDARQDDPRLATGKAPSCLSGTRTMAITTQLASIPGQHRASFLLKDIGYPDGGKGELL